MKPPSPNLRAAIVIVAMVVIGVVFLATQVEIPGVEKIVRPAPESVGTKCANGELDACRDLCEDLARVTTGFRCSVEITAPPGVERGNGPRPRLRIQTDRGGSSPSSPPPSSSATPSSSSSFPPTSNGHGNGPPDGSPPPSPPSPPPPAPTPTPTPNPPPGGSPGGVVGRTVDRVRTTVCPHLPAAAKGNPICP